MENKKKLIEVCESLQPPTNTQDTGDRIRAAGEQLNHSSALARSSSPLERPRSALAGSGGRPHPHRHTPQNCIGRQAAPPSGQGLCTSLFPPPRRRIPASPRKSERSAGFCPPLPPRGKLGPDSRRGAGTPSPREWRPTAAPREARARSPFPTVPAPHRGKPATLSA
jgi:hypothetical protein